MPPYFFEIDEKVLAFIQKTAEDVGRRACDEFDQEVWNRIQDYKITSPIEQYFLAALLFAAKTHDMKDSEPFELDGKEYVEGLHIVPQRQIGNYRVDFYVCWSCVLRHQDGSGRYQHHGKNVVVECDSQQWHERTERERRYEKARDRFLTKEGYTLLHFTGTEILANPLKVAWEVLNFTTDSNHPYPFDGKV